MSHAAYLQSHRAYTARPKHSEEKRHQVILLWTCAVCLCVVTGALYILYKTVTSKTVAAVSASPSNTNSVAKKTPKRGPATRALKEKRILPVTEGQQRIDTMLDVLALANAPNSTPTGESSTDTTTDNSLTQQSQPIEQKQEMIAISTANSNLTPPPAAEQESALNVIPALQTESQKTADAGQLIIPGLRTWTREDGATLEGKFLGYKEGSIDEIRILKKDDLKEYPVSLNTLVDADRHFVMMEITKLEATKLTPAAPKVTDVVPPPAETKPSPAAKPVDRTWTLRDGNRYDGSFLRIHNGSVVIKLKQGGRPKLLPYSRLSMADQVYVDEIKPSAEGKNTELATKSGKLSEEKPQVERPTALKEAFDKLNSAAVNPIPTEIQEFIATYDDEANKARATRLDALKNIGAFHEQAAPALPFLRRLLLGEDLEIRQTVFQTLENIGRPSEPTYIAILEAMKDPREFVREQLWHGPHVLRTTKSKYQTLACYALTALGRLGSEAKEATPILLEIATQSDRVFYAWQRSGETDQPFQVPDATFLGSEALGALRVIGSDYKDVSNGLVNLSIMATRRLRYLDRNDQTPRDMWDKSPHVHLRNTLLNQCVAAFEMLGGMTPPPKEVVPPACRLLEGHYAIRESVSILGRVGPDATDALKYLRPLLADRKLGPAAEEAIAQITRK